MKCGKCQDVVPVDSESVACGVCSAKFHYDCSVRETKWRNMSVEQKVKWMCIKCKSNTNISRPNSAGSSLSDVDSVALVEDDVSTKALILKLHTRLDTLDAVKKSVDVIASSLEFLSGRYDELLEEVRGHKEENKELRKEVLQLKGECSRRDEQLASLTRRFNALEQYGRGVNLEIHGLEEADYESDESTLRKVAGALGLPFNAAEIQAAHRVPSRDKQRTPMFLVQFVNKATRQQWLHIGRKKRLQSRDVVGVGSGRVYFNDNLTPYFSKLLWETKKVAREKNYASCWMMNCTIRVKKTREARDTITIADFDDLKKLV